MGVFESATKSLQEARLQLSHTTAKNLVAYTVKNKLVARKSRRVCRYDCLPTILLGLLVALVLVATIQVVVIHWYGAAYRGKLNAAQAYSYTYAGPAGLLPRMAVSPVPKINLHSLLNRNVPSILANYKRLQQEINVAAVNDILDNASKLTFTQPPNTKNIHLATQQEDNWLLRSLSDNVTTARTQHTNRPKLLEDCPEVPDELKIQPGGSSRPSHCHPRHHVAIIIPYRDRKHHLMVLLAHLHPILLRQQIDYTVFVIEQYGNKTFNKARIMNIAFVTALKQSENFGCFIFHDVDLIPEDDRNMYSCPVQPRHMSVAIDEMNYQVPYEELVGGVFAIRTEHFFKVNGYSNLYWGWGAEDDDMAYRLQHVGLKITRPPAQVARYKMIHHTKRPAVDGRIRYRLLWTGVRRYKIDGLNSLSSLGYKILHIEKRPVFTHILVDIGSPPPGF